MPTDASDAPTSEQPDFVSYVGPLIDHGSTLGVSGTAFLRLLVSSGISEVEVFCPKRNQNSIDKYPIYPAHVHLRESYTEGDPFSELKTIISVLHGKSKSILFNMHPTSQGKSALSNLIWIASAILLSSLRKHVIIIWHNSAFTNDFVKLGYTGLANRVKASLLRIIEVIMFRKAKVYVLSDSYRDLINSKVSDGVLALLLPHIEPIALLDSKNLANVVTFKINQPPEHMITVHMHGNWGPQKDLDFVLDILERVKQRGVTFRLLLTGSINPNFPGYDRVFWDTVAKHKRIVSEIEIPVSTSRLFDYFSETDIVILPYNTPGGRSGVMDIASFFKCVVICPPYQEYHEQAAFYDHVKFATFSQFEDEILAQLARADFPQTKEIDVRKEVDRSVSMFKRIL